MLLSCLDSNCRRNFVAPFCMHQTLVIVNLRQLHLIMTHKLLSFYKFCTLSYTVFFHSHTNSYSCVFWCLLTASSGYCTPSAVPSQHNKCLCIFISCIKECSLLTNTPLSLSFKVFLLNVWLVTGYMFRVKIVDSYNKTN